MERLATSTVVYDDDDETSSGCVTDYACTRTRTARHVPEGPHVALEEARWLLGHMTPALRAELAEAALRGVSDEAAQVVVLNRLCRSEPETWGVVAEQLTQLVVRQHSNAISSIEEARTQRAQADVMERNAQSQRKAAETCALQILRSLPANLTSDLLGDHTAGEVE